MRVALDLRAAHPGLTGIGRYAVNLCLSLEKAAPSMDLEVFTTPAGLEYLRPQTGARMHVVSGSDADWDEFVLPDVLSALDVDLFHSPLFVLPNVQSCATVCTIHDAIPLARPDLSSPSFIRFFRKHAARAIRRASHIVTVSQYSKEDIARFFPESAGRLTAVHEPVGPIFTPRTPQRCAATLEKYGVGRRFILYVGALDRRKNLSALLEAYRLLREHDPESPDLLVAGGASGDGYDLTEDLSTRGLRGHVLVLGRVSDEEAACLYSSASVFVFPSLYEGFGLPVVEAMACGTPVVSSRSTSLGEVAGGAAMLVDPNDPRDIRDVLAHVLEDPDLRSTLRTKGLARARKFSLERQGQELSELYGAILERVA